MLELVGKHTFIDTIRSWIRRIIAKFQKADSDVEKQIRIELIKIQDAIEKMYKQSQKQGFADDEVKYSIEYTTDNKPVVIVEDNILEGVPKSEWVKTVKKVIADKFSSGIPISGRLVKVNKITRNEFTNSKYTQNLREFENVIYEDKFKSANNLDEIILATTNYVNEDLNHTRKDNFKEFARGDVLIRVGKNDYSAKVIVGFTTGNQMVLYDIIRFSQTEITTKKENTHTVQSPKVKNSRTSVSSNNNIPHNSKVVNSSISENAENETENIKYSLDVDSNKKITVDMSDSERAEILKNKSLTVEHYSGQADNLIEENSKELESQKTGIVKKALKKVADNFGNYGKYNVKDFYIEVSYSSNTIKESASKVTDTKTLSKLFPIIDKAIENAIGINSENNRYYYDNKTNYYHTLLSGYIDGEYFVPIRFGVKENIQGENKLYIVVEQNKIDLKVLKLPVLEKGYDDSRLRSIISISEFFKNVNSKDLLRYVPDEMLDESQKKIKYEGIAETIKYTNDKNDRKYAEFVKKGDLASAARMVEAKAKDHGYAVKAYHGTLTKGITEFKKEFIGSRFSYDEVGFFFTDNLSIAEDYATSEFNADRKGEVISAYLKTSNAFVFDKNYALKNGYGNVFRDNDNINVWDIYQTALLEEAEEHNADSIIIKDGQSMMIVVFDPNQIKSADPVTYDDDGNVIPLSKRFKENQDDIRFSLDIDTSKMTASEFVKSLGKNIMHNLMRLILHIIKRTELQRRNLLQKKPLQILRILLCSTTIYHKK